MNIAPSQVLHALIAYAGPLDDPRVGWVGRNPSSNDHFQCERCGAEHLDCTQIPHLPGCAAAEVLAVLRAAQEQKGDVA